MLFYLTVLLNILFIYHLFHVKTTTLIQWENLKLLQHRKVSIIQSPFQFQ